LRHFAEKVLDGGGDQPQGNDRTAPMTDLPLPPNLLDRDRPCSLAVFGAGYVGGAFVREAVVRGWRVAALTRNPERAAALRAAGCALVVEADLAGETWHAEMRGPFEAVLNCVSAGGGGAAGYRRAYVDGNRSVGRWLATQPAGGTIVYTSSTGVYPQGGGVRVTEEAPTGGASETGAVLREAEEELAHGATVGKWRWFVLRLAGIYGPGRHGMLDQIRAGAAALPGDPAHHMNLIHRDDVCGAVWTCLAAAAGTGDQILNVTDGTPATRAEVAQWLAARLGVAMPTLDATGSTAGPNPFRGRPRAPDRIIVADKIRQLLGWVPRYPDFRAGYESIWEGEAGSGKGRMTND
jgi:nucleoside-diphosphate-sugar epimerase